MRAIAIGLVCLGHFTATVAHAHPSRLLSNLQIGELGVRVFFVLSGFLITGILMSEMERTAGIRLPRFYFRRVLRIFPAFYVFAIAVVVLDAAGIFHAQYGNALAAFTYTSDYFPTGTWNLAHTWSLSIEEQFYLLWPAGILLLGRKRAWLAPAALMLLAPCTRVISLYLTVHHLNGVPVLSGNPAYRFDTQADALAIGCLLALARPALHRMPAYLRLLRSRWTPFLPLAVLCLEELGDHLPTPLYAVYLALGILASNLFIALFVDWAVVHSTGRVGRILNSQPFVIVGLVSYSLYLWQQIFLNPYGETRTFWLLLCLPVALLVAIASYLLIEQPLLRLRARLEPRIFRPRPVGRAPEVALASQPPPRTGGESDRPTFPRSRS